MTEKIIGILGGMGPKSTADFFLKVIHATPATKDQDHPRIIIDCNPKIPDRTAAILGKGESPLKQLKDTAFNLERSGAEIIVIPCNTAHYFYEELQKSVHIPIIHMLSETAAYICNTYPKAKKIGLLATTGTIETKIYQHVLDGLQLIVPDGSGQKRVMTAIYGKRGLKAGFSRNLPRRYILEEARKLVVKGAEVLILGCTETSLVIQQKDLRVPLIDPLQILAEVLIRKAQLNT